MPSVMKSCFAFLVFLATHLKVRWRKIVVAKNKLSSSTKTPDLAHLHCPATAYTGRASPSQFAAKGDTASSMIDTVLTLLGERYKYSEQITVGPQVDRILASVLAYLWLIG